MIPNQIVPMKKANLRESKDEPTLNPPSKDEMKVFGVPADAKSNAQDPVDPKTQWKELRSGLKLRNIIHSKRMGDLGVRTGIKQSRLIMQRHLGYKEMIAGAGQWELLTKQKDECWHCGQHILTLFIWTPRIGLLTSSKDQVVIKHYRDQMEAVNADDDFMPTFF